MSRQIDVSMLMKLPKWFAEEELKVVGLLIVRTDKHDPPGVRHMQVFAVRHQNSLANLLDDMDSEERDEIEALVLEEYMKRSRERINMLAYNLGVIVWPEVLT